MFDLTSKEPAELTAAELDAISGGAKNVDPVVAAVLAYIAADIKAHPWPPVRLPGL